MCGGTHTTHRGPKESPRPGVCGKAAAPLAWQGLDAEQLDGIPSVVGGKVPRAFSWIWGVSGAGGCWGTGAPPGVGV